MLVVLICSAAPTIEVSAEVVAQPSVHVLGGWPPMKCFISCIELYGVALVSCFL